ncbi:melanoma-associated antigen B10 [Ictidomys tridecemlineatus]|uniref:melanoma-associated antigen B10-like n=1 Tax=Ictidomys tridecemlineatus TaxID=43179 RepID=UPI00025DDE58|nr:melanoma-associated antigen B10-like [Ictidomys tridecemlineatus]XP_040144082.1 melanoma-associated antigen B10-like [Ictidomys tridecemlineatus]XP_040144087.1 melanoma-associated antigen B10-like [Ictidomys tridecemlineatus]KAG3271869.1 melanoma-associated antigen B10-like [Ictidomys tridecemlineatus]
MPRGQKSKLRAREKHRQAQTQGQPNGLEGAQATARAGGEFHSSSSSRSKSNPRSSAAARTTSNPQGSWRAASTTTTSAVVSYRRSNGSGNNQVEERPSSSQAQLATGHLSRGRLDEKVVILVHYLLYKYQMKEPITKAEMLRNIIQMHKSHFLEILRKASEHLELVFGLDIKEMDSNKHIYILINKLELSYDARLSDNGGVPKTGLLMTILGVIFTKGNRATEEQVWQILNAMGLYSGREHFIFGEPRKLITKDLVKEKYLEYQQVPDSDPPRYEFLWGPRAYAETSKMKVLEFLAKVHDTIPSAYPTWYEEALRDEEARAQARAAARAHISAIVSARSRALSSYSSRPK